MTDPFLVVGTGRCGTSTVARLMHTKLNIFMGEKFEPADIHNPDGYYEDLEFGDLHNDFVYHEKITYKTWDNLVKDVIEKRCQLNQYWGFKGGGLSELLGLYFGLFDNPKVIWCIRNKEDTIASMYRSFNMPNALANLLYSCRLARLRRFLTGRDYLALDFNERRSDEYIIEAITRKWDFLEENK